MVTRSRKENLRNRLPQQLTRIIAFIAIGVGLLGNSVIVSGEERFEFREPHLGTIVTLTLYAPNETAANESSRAAFARIEELNQILSDYNPDSEVMKLCRTAGTGQAVPVSQDLFDVLARSVEISVATDGAFDVSISPVVKLWRSARRIRKLPSEKELADAKALVGYQNIILNEKQRTVELRKKGMLLDFGGIAKGYIAEQTRALLAARGLRRTLTAVAGDIAAGDAPPGQDGWRIGVAPLEKADGEPSRYLRLVNNSISTSGDAFQFVEIAGVRYSHIVDPKTALGLTRRSSVTIVAPQGSSADGLATAVSVLGPERGLKLIEKMKGMAALIVVADEAGITVRESSEFAKFVIP